MKKNRTHTNGYTLSLILILMIALFSILYIKWYLSDRDQEKDKIQTVSMIQNLQSQGQFAVEEAGYINVIK